ncbi:flagellar hook protein FlgE [Geodermatophilus sp. SYSU D00758]
MLRSMFSAISGLRAHQTKMDVTGNNIANVNTVGYKSQSTVFEDTLSQMMRAGGAPTEARGGTNPAQVGLGVKLGGISTNWTQGATQTTGRSTDFMVEGDGFFVVQAGTQQLFTRAGSFSFDSAGNLVTASGAVLQGWSADADGVVNPNGPIGDLAIPYGQGTAPRRTGNGSVEGNLSASAPVGTAVETAITMFDDLGREVPVTYAYRKTADNTWGLTVTARGTTVHTSSVTFDGVSGALSSASPVTLTGIPGLTGSVSVDLSTITQYGSPTDVSADDQDGYGAGTLESFSLGSDGTVTGMFSNGERKVLGQLALAAFDNPSGLEKAGSSMFRAANNSGLPDIGQAGAGGRGALTAGALEMSNVDLAEEFTGLIVAQRGFQANSRVITSSDEILQDLVNLKR